MKQSILAASVLIALGLANTAQAQTNVQVYGLIDAGIEYISDATPSKASMTRVITGGKNTARWGIRGSEDLGSGLKASFNLEGGVLVDTGNIDGVLFKRQANVGIEGSFGKVIIGRSFTTVYDFLIAVDPMGFAPNYSWSTSGNATGPSKYGMTTAFDNLIKYSNQSGPFKFGASYGFGEQATGAADSRKYALATSYNANGMVLLATWEQVNGNTVAGTTKRDETKVYHLAADYRTGQWRMGAGMRDYVLVAGKAATADVKATTTWAGVSYYPVPEVTLTGAIYHVDVKNLAAGADADPTLYVLRAMYALSKRTDLYTTLGHAKAKNGKLVGLSRDDAGFSSTQNGLTAGIQHRF